MPHTDLEERAIRAMYKQTEKRDRASLKRAQALAVAEFKARLAVKGKAPTRDEVKAAEVQAFKKWSSARMVASWNAELK